MCKSCLYGFHPIGGAVMRLKRTIGGTYVSVEPFHLFRYLDEQAFRFNERRGTDADRFDSALSHVTGRRVMYKTLTAKPDDENVV